MTKKTGSGTARRTARRIAAAKRTPKEASENYPPPLGGLRDVLYRPDRLEYIRGQKIRLSKEERAKASNCVFCGSLGRGVSSSSLVLYSGAEAFVIMNKYPYNLGHLMVLPKRHEGDPVALETSEYTEVFGLVRRSIAVLRKGLEVEDFNIGMNLGKGAGAGIPEHMHVHIIPRWRGDTNFFPLIGGTKVLPGDLSTIFQILEPLFKGIHA